MNKEKLSFVLLIWILLLCLLICVFLGLRFGSAELSMHQVFSGLFRRNPDSIETKVIWVIRLPHVIGCILCGMALSISGVLLQTATNNPLAGPNIIGVNAGAGFAVVLFMCLYPMGYRFVPMAAFIGAFLCTILIVTAADKAGGSRVTLVLSGVAVSTLLNAGISFLKLLYPDTSIAYNYFSAGGIDGVTFSQMLVPAVMIFITALLSMLLANRFNLLCLGDSIVHSLGLRARVLRTIALLLASASAAAAVSFAGLLGFVGLMVPHIARRFVGSSDLRKLLPVSAMLGSMLVLLADLFGRTAFAPSQIPAGIITALIGVPFFFLLLFQRRYRL